MPFTLDINTINKHDDGTSDIDFSCSEFLLTQGVDEVGNPIETVDRWNTWKHSVRLLTIDDDDIKKELDKYLSDYILGNY